MPDLRFTTGIQRRPSAVGIDPDEIAAVRPIETASGERSEIILKSGATLTVDQSSFEVIGKWEEAKSQKRSDDV